MTTWILVADAGRAKLYSAELRADKWSLIKEFEHPEGRQTSSEISPSSPPGSSEQSQGHGARHTAYEPRTTPKKAETDRFAQHLADHLEKATASREFDALVLVAPPRFLGMLRGALGQQAAKQLRTSVDKDLSMFSVEALREHLTDVVFPSTSAAG